jgi:hypothetical protein
MKVMECKRVKELQEQLDAILAKVKKNANQKNQMELRHIKGLLKMWKLTDGFVTEDIKPLDFNRKMDKVQEELMDDLRNDPLKYVDIRKVIAESVNCRAHVNSKQKEV